MLLSELLQNARLAPAAALEAAAAVAFVTDDSRKTAPGCVFVCIEGAHFDGHTRAAQALEAGALCVVVQKDMGLAKQLLVQDTRAAYALLCAAWHGSPAQKLRIVGVTGTNGKTTTAFLLKEIFDHSGYKTGLIGTLVNMVGKETLEASLTTPDPWELQGLFARMVETGCTHCFMEVSSQALAQRRVEGLRFAAGIFTNLTQDHLDYHGTLDAYRAAKTSLFAQCDLAVVNLDDEAAPAMLEGGAARRATYSLRRDSADYTAKNVQLGADGVIYELVGHSTIGRVRFGVPGAFSVYNSLAAACAALELGIELPQVLAALEASRGVRGRMEPVPVDAGFAVLIDYAHSPDGLENVLRALRGAVQGRIITVFGCGGDRDKTKRSLMGKIAAELSDICVVSSDNPRSEDPGAIIADILAGIKNRGGVLVEPDRRQAIYAALRRARADDVVLLAGKGQETYQILAAGKVHLDEREVVREYFQEQSAGSKK
ncbi:MAG: UDP-N-acetylmuramoyl-L-alanyl-D-glutamate--2,6-diaminopimelate ligase [Oscillospiraceae bacterium]|jgi:UDP-N-acetylmuramoyl-L-alanyl-D-glutamate--2,6-diaminopimelate ligase|nr:UDP-N-acetylmuramoyl-L-alanyl-D-glutamate--2,6-diaminopimelate ligase [Oscillospiraceae bacterium]